MRLLLTGASGFVGSAVLRRLKTETGWDVHLVSRQRPPELQADWTHHPVDLLEPGRARSLIAEVAPSHLLHLAWNAEPGVFWTAPDNLTWTAASLELYRAFVDAGGWRAVMAGTCAEYDWSGPKLVEGETPLRPTSLYGVAKDALRRIVEAAAQQENASWAWGRIFFVYGPQERPGRLVSDISDALREGRPAECSDGVQERDFMHVDDVAGAFVAALTSDYDGVFNIASGRPSTIREIVERLGEVAGRPDLLRLGARPARPGDPPRLVGDGSVLRQRIGFHPSFDLAEGLRDSYLRRGPIRAA